MMNRACLAGPPSGSPPGVYEVPSCPSPAPLHRPFAARMELAGDSELIPRSRFCYRRSMVEVPKRVKRLLRAYATAAHEAELGLALRSLADAFKQWERGELDSFALEDLIHRFHQGPARELYRRYGTNQRAAQVAYAIVTGALDRAAVPAELLDHLAGLIRFYESEQAESGG